MTARPRTPLYASRRERPLRVVFVSPSRSLKASVNGLPSGECAAIRIELISTRTLPGALRRLGVGSVWPLTVVAPLTISTGC